MLNPAPLQCEDSGGYTVCKKRQWNPLRICFGFELVARECEPRESPKLNLNMTLIVAPNTAWKREITSSGASLVTS